MGNSKSKKKSKLYPAISPSVLRVKSGSIDEMSMMDFKDDKNDCDKAPHYNCDACKRIVNVLNYYHKWNQYHSPKNSTSSSSSSSDNNNNNNNIIDKEYDVGMFEYINTSYDLTQLNDDFIHIVEDHSDELEELYKYTLQQLNIVSCNISSCRMIERNNRSRSRFATDTSLRKSLYNGYETSEEIATQQTLDKIHSYILHSFDSLKLTNDEIDRIELIQDTPSNNNNDGNNESVESESDEDSDDDDDETKPLKDETLAEYKKIMDDKKRIMRDIINVRQKSNKFASDHYENDRKQYCDNQQQDDEKKGDSNINENENNLQDQESEMEDESDNDNDNNNKIKKLETYSFGIRWYYWEYYRI